MNAGTGTPLTAAAATTRRQASWLASTLSRKNGSSSRLDSAGFLSKASLILPRKAERMMQPPRHMSATPP